MLLAPLLNKSNEKVYLDGNVCHSIFNMVPSHNVFVVLFFFSSRSQYFKL